MKLSIICLLLTLSCCTTYKNVCKDFLQPKVDMLAETISIQCDCNSASVHKLFNKVPAQICMEGKESLKDMIDSNVRDGSPLGMLACSLTTDIIIELSGQFLSEKIDCALPLDKCLPSDLLRRFIDDKICSTL